jgi:hypothetical protein
MKATLRLFKAVPVSNKKYSKFMSIDYMKKTLPYGFVLAPEILGNYDHAEVQNIVKMTIKELGLSSKQMNSSFHKSWGKVAIAPMEQLVMEQLIHYLTTYGFEQLGIYNEDSVYIPAEALDIPEFEGLNLIVVKGLSKEELYTKILDILNSGMALKDDTITDVIDVALFVELSESDIIRTKNKEVKIALFDYFGIVPADPIEFLRFVLFKALNKTLLIKDAATISMLKQRDNKNIVGLFSQYEKKYGLETLASIFYRFKPLFLALRTNEFLKRKVNRIRKLADVYHRPMRQDYLNNITVFIKNNTLDLDELKNELANPNINIFRKIRLANTLSYRANTEDNSILYKIRNGKGFATKFENINKIDCHNALETVLNSIGNDLRPTLDGKTIYIPNNIFYSVPATEKQFTGMFPSGTYISTKKDLIVGVYWENVGNFRVDLDLSFVALNTKIGWDASYRTPERDILFSGDMTDATNGASELFYIKGKKIEAYTLMLNYYNGNVANAPEVPFKILAANEIPHEMFEKYDRNRHYMIDPNNLIAQTDSKMIPAQKQKVIGLVETRPEEVRFYFSEFNAGNSITSESKPHANFAREYLINYHRTMIKLSDILIASGVVFVNTPEKCDIDLSPNKLEKDTFINILVGK